MKVVVYRAKVKDGFLYDITLNPLVDFEILKKTRRIEFMEVITPEISLEMGQLVLKGIYGSLSVIGRFIPYKDFAINSVLKKLNINRVKRFVDKGEEAPTTLEMAALEEHIRGRVVKLQGLIDLSAAIQMDKRMIINTIQALYCLRRISIAVCSNDLNKNRSVGLCENDRCLLKLIKYKKGDILLYQADNYNINKSSFSRVIKKKLSAISKNAEEEFIGYIKSKKAACILWCAPNVFEYDILSEGIVEILNNGGRVLIVTSRFYTHETREAYKISISGAKIEITDGFKPNYRSLDITICSFDEYPLFYKCFDLVIVDSRYLFLDKSTEDMSNICRKAVKEKGKLLNITCCPQTSKLGNIKGVQYITMPVGYMKNPIPEPRIITSRYLKNTKGFLPGMALEMIKWSMMEGSKVIIFVPDYNWTLGVCEFIKNEIGIKDHIFEISDEKNKSALIRFKRGEASILISDDIKDVINVIEDVNIIVIQGDEKDFSTDCLVNMASMAAYHTRNKLREVIFISPEESECVLLARTAIRSINKAAWEKGYLKE